MRKSIARKLTFRAALLLLLVLVILCVGSYFMVRSLIVQENERYTRAILAMYTDLVTYQASEEGIPIDRDYMDKAHVYSRYICDWYNIEFIYLLGVNPDYSVCQYIDFCFGDEKMSSEMMKIIREGPEFEPDPSMLDVLNNQEKDIVADFDLHYGAVGVKMKARDSFGNTLLSGVAISVKSMIDKVNRIFIFIAAALLLVFTGLIFLIYFRIVKKVSLPAQAISQAMTRFITDGKRTDIRLDESRDDEYGMIAKAFNSMTVDIDRYMKDIRSLNEDRKDQKSQMETASSIQKGFLPPENYVTKDFEIRALMNPAREVGGDLYDYLPLGKNRILFVVADVSGKGMAAAIFMSVTLMLIRQYAKSGLSPARILESVNNTLAEQNPRMLFATAFVGIYDSGTRKLLFANAGHNPPYILHDDLREPVRFQNTVLGLFEGEKYKEETVTLHIGDVLFLYTDGVDEATDPEMNFFGTERLQQALLDAKTEHEENLTGYVLNSLNAFTAGAEQHDDITMMSLTVRKTVNLNLDADTREFSKIRETILKCDLSRQLQLDLCVAAEEIFINICSYAFEGKASQVEKIYFTLVHSDRIMMRFSDGGIHYDPRENVMTAEDYDMDLQVGGLGRLIAFNIADEVDYEYTNGRNILTVTKYIKEEEKDDDSADQ